MRLHHLFVGIVAIAMSMALPAAAVELGKDGLHKPAWFVETVKDLRDDLENANAQGKRLLLILERRGCIYCTQMHERVYPDPEITKLLSEKFTVIQINLFGNAEVIDFDGTTKQERDMARHWGAVFTPTLFFAPESLPTNGGLRNSAVMVVTGAFERGTTQAMLNWVLERGYDGDEQFQNYVARTRQ